MASTVLLRNIASDAASILQARLSDRRRSKPFEALADRSEDDLGRDLLAALHRERKSLTAVHLAVAEEFDQLLTRMDQALR
jgi:hypothetical protein